MCSQDHNLRFLDVALYSGAGSNDLRIVLPKFHVVHSDLLRHMSLLAVHCHNQRFAVYPRMIAGSLIHRLSYETENPFGAQKSHPDCIPGPVADFVKNADYLLFEFEEESNHLVAVVDDTKFCRWAQQIFGALRWILGILVDNF